MTKKELKKKNIESFKKLLEMVQEYDLMDYEKKDLGKLVKIIIIESKKLFSHVKSNSFYEEVIPSVTFMKITGLNEIDEDWFSDEADFYVFNKVQKGANFLQALFESYYVMRTMQNAIQDNAYLLDFDSFKLNKSELATLVS